MNTKNLRTIFETFEVPKTSLDWALFVSFQTRRINELAENPQFRDVLEGLFQHRFLNYTLDPETPLDIEMPRRSILQFHKYTNGCNYTITNSHTKNILHSEHTFRSLDDAMDELTQVLTIILDRHQIPEDEIKKMIHHVFTNAAIHIIPTPTLR